MTPITHAPVQHVVHDVHDAPTGLRAHLPNLTLGLLRVVAGLMFMQHGAQKLFGALLPADQPFQGGPEIFSMMWIAGIVELGGGFLLALGLFTRVAAFLMAGQMAVAYFKVHNPQGFWPILNGGELAALYSFVFLMFVGVGSGRFSLDQLLRRSHRQAPAQPVVAREVRPRDEIPEVPEVPVTPVRSAEIEVPIARSRPTREP